MNVKKLLPDTATTPRTRHNERGVSLVEAIIGLLVLTIVLLAGAQLFRVHVEHLSLVERARRADVQANATMNTLAAYNLSALPPARALMTQSPTANKSLSIAILVWPKPTAISSPNLPSLAAPDRITSPWAGINQLPPAHQLSITEPGESQLSTAQKDYVESL